VDSLYLSDTDSIFLYRKLRLCKHRPPCLNKNAGFVGSFTACASNVPYRGTWRIDQLCFSRLMRWNRCELKCTGSWSPCLTQARSQVLNFFGGGQQNNAFLRGQYSCFDYMFKITFSRHNKIWEEATLQSPPVATGLVLTYYPVWRKL